MHVGGPSNGAGRVSRGEAWQFHSLAHELRLRVGPRLVYLERIQSGDFGLLDFKTKATRQLTSLGNRGALRTFDITPDGKYIVFDRSRQNSNIVLIDLSK